MAIDNPPTYWFPNINFNSTFYEPPSGGGGLSIAQANTLYLQKTVPDVANVLETFNGGIYIESDDYETTQSADKLTINYKPTVDGNRMNLTREGLEVNNGTYVARYYPLNTTISDGFSYSVFTSSANNMTLNSNQYFPSGYKTEILNDATQAKLTISNKNGGNSVVTTETGISVNTATQSTTYTLGAITASNGLSLQAGNANTINLGTTIARTADINIGNTTITTNITGTAVLGTTETDTIVGSATTGTQTLYSTKTAGDLTCLGAGSGTLTVNGFGVVTNNINPTIGSSNIIIGANSTSGDIKLGGGQTSGKVILGVNGGTGTINMLRPIVIGYAPSAITANTQIGYTTTDTITNTGTIPTVVNTNAFTTAVVLPQGVWLIQYSIRIRPASGSMTISSYGTWGYENANGVNYPYAQFYSQTGGVSATIMASNGSFVLSSSGTLGYNINVYINNTGSAASIATSGNDYSVIRRTRIA